MSEVFPVFLRLLLFSVIYFRRCMQLSFLCCGDWRRQGAGDGTRNPSCETLAPLCECEHFIGEIAAASFCISPSEVCPVRVIMLRLCPGNDKVLAPPLSTTRLFVRMRALASSSVRLSVSRIRTLYQNDSVADWVWRRGHYPSNYTFNSLVFHSRVFSPPPDE